MKPKRDPVRRAIAIAIAVGLALVPAAPAMGDLAPPPSVQGPTISGFAATPPVVSPNGDGSADATSIAATLAGQGQIAWQLRILEATEGTEVLVASGSGSTVAVGWDGRPEQLPGGVLYGMPLPQGAYEVRLVGTDATGSRQAVTELWIDEAAPDLVTLLPRRDGHSVVPSQVLAARFSDEYSEVARGSISFRLTDETDGSVVRIGPELVGFDPETGWATTPAVPLIEGHGYSIAVEVADAAGNATTYRSDRGDGAGFVATSVVPEATSISVPPTSCTLATVANVDGSRDVTCPAVPVHIEPAVVAHGPEAGQGTALLLYDLGLDQGILTDPATGASIGPWELGGDVPEAAIALIAPLGGGSVRAHASDFAGIDEVRGTVPASWTGARFSLEGVAMPVSSCSDPTQAGCFTDPIMDVRSWFPATSSFPRSRECDLMLDHEPVVRVEAGRDLVIEVGVDPRVSAAEASVRYSIDGSDEMSLTGPVDQGSATFTIPTDLLPDGSVVSYVVSAEPDEGSQECADVGGIERPSDASFRVSIGSIEDLDEADALDAVFPLRLGDQLDGIDRPLEELCGARFARPTPCEILDEVVGPVPALPDPAPLPDPQEVAANGSGRVCTVAGEENGIWATGPYSSGAFAETWGAKYEKSQQWEDRVAMEHAGWTDSSSFWSENGSTSGTSGAGLAFAYEGGASSYKVDVVLRWDVHGMVRAQASSHMLPCFLWQCAVYDLTTKAQAEVKAPTVTGRIINLSNYAAGYYGKKKVWQGVGVYREDGPLPFVWNDSGEVRQDAFEALATWTGITMKRNQQYAFEAALTTDQWSAVQHGSAKTTSQFAGQHYGYAGAQAGVQATSLTVTLPEGVEWGYCNG